MEAFFFLGAECSITNKGDEHRGEHEEGSLQEETSTETSTGQYQANVLRLQAGICVGQWMVEAHRGLPLLHSSVIFQCWCQDHPAKSNHPSSLVQIFYLLVIITQREVK